MTSSVLFLTFFLCILHTSVPVPVRRHEDITPMLRMLDGMQQMMTGEPQFDREFYGQLRDCMATFDPQLPAVQDKAWQGIIDYWNMGGAQDDLWGEKRSPFMENNITVTNVDGMKIIEPCDYASNIAYYRDVTSICLRRENGPPFSWPEEYTLALGKSYSALAMGSSFYHGSNTDLGGQQDTHTISVVSYVIQQGSMSCFPDAPPVLTDFQPTKRNKTASELAEAFDDIYSNLPVDQWYDQIEELDLPDFYWSYSGIFSTVMTICFEPEVVDHYVPILAHAFGLDEEYITFLLDSYLPALRNITSDLVIEDDVKQAFFDDSIATVAKLIYAFLWQEEILTDNPIFFDPEVNAIGAELLPIINAEVDKLSNFQYYDEDYQAGNNIYPGDTWCNPVIPHAKWHLESGIGMLDVAYLGDEIFRIYSTAPRNLTDVHLPDRYY